VQHLPWIASLASGSLWGREKATNKWPLTVVEFIPSCHRTSIAPERLRIVLRQNVVYEVKEGWEPLRDFLGVEAPKDKPFPHLNDSDSFRKIV
jgi:hypothetical protein